MWFAVSGCQAFEADSHSLCGHRLGDVGQLFGELAELADVAGDVSHVDAKHFPVFEIVDAAALLIRRCRMRQLFRQFSLKLRSAVSFRQAFDVSQNGEQVVVLQS